MKEPLKQSFRIPLKDPIKGVQIAIITPAAGQVGSRSIYSPQVFINSIEEEKASASLMHAELTVFRPEKRQRQASKISKPYISWQEVNKGEVSLMVGLRVKQFDNPRENFQMVRLSNIDANQLTEAKKMKISSALEEFSLIVKEAIYDLSTLEKAGTFLIGKDKKAFSFKDYGMMINSSDLPLPQGLIEKLGLKEGASFTTLFEETLAKGVSASALSKQFKAIKIGVKSAEQTKPENFKKNKVRKEILDNGVKVKELNRLQEIEKHTQPPKTTMTPTKPNI